MGVLSPDAFERLLGGLDREAFARFVADLWSARGWETGVEAGGRLVVATDPDGARRRTL
ncbi:MAG: hypothetical protein ABEJ28_03685 [Salinigranum sp.]